MKKIFLSVLLFFLIFAHLFAQEKEKIKTDFKLFNWSSLSYTFGLNDVNLNEKLNSLQLKTVIGLATPKTGLGIGLENATFRNPNSTTGGSFNTLSFSGNLHQLIKPIQDDELNFFLKGGAGYAVRIFRGYNKGINYELSSGVIFTTRKKSKIFLQAIYNYQEIDGFLLITGKPKITSFGLGIGTWVSR